MCVFAVNCDESDVSSVCSDGTDYNDSGIDELSVSSCRSSPAGDVQLRANDEASITLVQWLSNIAQ